MRHLTIFGHPGSTYVRTARMVCEEKGVPHTLETIGHEEIEKRQLHPFVKMPAMRDGDVQLFESLAIAEYVDGKFEGPPLKPQDPVQRARMYQWVSAINDYFYPSAIRRYVLATKFGGDPKDIDAARGEIQHHFCVVDRALGSGPFLAGRMISLADLFMAPILAYVEMMPEGPPILSDFSNVRRFAEAFTSRPSFRNTAP